MTYFIINMFLPCDFLKLNVSMPVLFNSDLTNDSEFLIIEYEEYERKVMIFICSKKNDVINIQDLSLKW
jgi:hypothetical protein